MLVETLTGKNKHNLYWALRDVSFNVYEKQRIGIIGPNGSGKTTLLRMITGNLQPSSGRIKVNGKISALLTQATALNPEESGISNIRYNLILNGVRQKDIPHLTEEIVDFAELGQFIYSPVKTYSAGMNARLSFAISTAIDPEILVVDEVLGTGDGYFMAKATQRMRDLCDRGKALLFVSHSTAAVQMMCDTALWLENGIIRALGPVEYVTKLYEQDYINKTNEITRIGNLQRKQEGINRVGHGEIQEHGIYKARIVPESESKRFVDVHYVRDVAITTEDKVARPIQLDTPPNDHTKDWGWLDLHESEWGRLYDKHGEECRILAANSGKGIGGQIVLQVPNQAASDSWPCRLTFETTSVKRDESLTVEVANYRTGVWEKALRVSAKPVPGRRDWQRVEADLMIPLIQDEATYHAAREAINAKSRPPVEILEVTTLADGAETGVINEREPFEIRVTVQANEAISPLDVGINIYRADGVYVFWQSSGLSHGNLEDVEGKMRFDFVFDPNPFACGEYFIGAYCGNGWDPVGNFPHSQVYDQKVNFRKFVVHREYEIVSFGQVNIRVPVKIVKGDME